MNHDQTTTAASRARAGNTQRRRGGEAHRRLGATGRGAQVALLLLGAVGCATSPGRPAEPGAPASAFPSREALAAVKATPAPQLGRAESYVDVTEWTLVGPFPADGRALAAGTEPWTAALTQAVTARAGVTLATEGMQCTARELGRFLLEHDKLPSPGLREFIAARCGAGVVQLSAQWLTGTAAPTMSDAELHQTWSAQLAPLYAELPPGNMDVGVALLRKGDKVVVLRAAGARLALLQGLAADPAAPGTLVLRAELLSEPASVRVMINRGAYGYAECQVVPELPRLVARCPVEPTDTHTWISVAAFPAGRVLGTRVLDVLAWPQSTPVDHYTRRAVTTTGAVAQPSDLHHGILHGINAVRAAARLEPLTEEVPESATAREVAPYYFAAQQRQIPETVADIVALGLRAGWQVSGLVAHGGFAAPATLGSQDVGQLLAMALEQPFGRETLLDPRAVRVAIGAVWEAETSFMGAVITTYALLEPPPPALTDAVWKKLDEARKGAGKPIFQRDDRFVARTPELRSALLAGDSDADGLLRELMRAYAQGASGYWIELDDVASFTVPPALVNSGAADVAVVVASHRREGEPWGRHVVFVVVAGGAELNI